ncbi:class E sortase [Prauserella endophytica]|uniref:Class E sortase n=1 Tax=Prauserella endophytica TaxID=1592324 RepID=A0ABY2SCG9_9PSEU|nr:class E sortase [Prauserella endophytica]TKG73354.1 class E sortase [Prauserella endophytica]
MSRYEEPETREIPIPDFSRRPAGPPRRPRQQQPPQRPPRRPDSNHRQPPPTRPPAPPAKSEGGGSAGRTIVRTFGEVLITLGVVVLLFVVYELYVTNWMSGKLQDQASADLDAEWANERELHAEPLDGKAFARIYIPSFGADWNFTVQQGVDSETLEIGPGHYKTTAMPGEPGNMGVAGHRVGKGAPFNDLDLLNSCDAIVIETADSFYVYRVLPMADEAAGWAEGKGRDPKCANVAPLRDRDGAYAETVGRVIVTPGRGDAVAPVPYQPADVLPKASQAALLTLTTCHPRFSDRERMIIHSVLTNQLKKQPGAGYDDLLAEIGEA